jgi:broad specificity phosphatase PhoE
LASNGVKLTHVFSSNMARARKTAESVLEAQKSKFGKHSGKLRVVQLASLREQDFGSLEKCSFANPPAPRWKRRRGEDHAERGDSVRREVESKESLTLRSKSFIESSILPLMLDPTSTRKEPIIAVVSHGMLLISLWKALLKRFALFSVSLAPGVQMRKEGGDDLERIGGWSNTGFLELEILHQPSKLKAAEATKGVVSSLAVSPSKPVNPVVLYDWTMKVLAVNSTAHLRGLKRTRGGVGSSKHDEDQKPLETYFNKKRRIA